MMQRYLVHKLIHKPPCQPMSSSSESDDDEKAKLAQAVDPDFLNNQLKDGNGKDSSKDGKAAESSDPLPPSKRAKIFNANPDSSEFAQLYSLDVTPDSKKFIAKQLAKSLDENLEEVSPPLPSKSTKSDCGGIRLFASSTEVVTEDDLKSVEPPRRRHKKKSMPKANIKRKGPGKSSDSSDSEVDVEKLKSVAVTADWVLRQ